MNESLFGSVRRIEMPGKVGSLDYIMQKLEDFL